MNRRKFLEANGVGVALGLSGCLDTAGLIAADWSPETLPLELSVAQVDDAPDEHGIALNVELSSPRLTDDEPPELHLQVNNVGSNRIGFNSWHKYRAGQFHSSDPEGLLTITTNEPNHLELNSEGCWSLEGDLVRTLAARMASLEPDDSESDTRHLIHWTPGNSAGKTRPEPGEYTFKTIYRILNEGTGNRDPFSNETESDLFMTDGESVECGFTIEIAEGER